MPSVDISETDAAYLFKGEIPGVKKLGCQDHHPGQYDQCHAAQARKGKGEGD
jgi:hypothetical protein